MLGNTAQACLYWSADCLLNEQMLMNRGFVNGEVFEDTKQRTKPIVFLYGSRPFTAGLCLGVEKALQGMKAGNPKILSQNLSYLFS